MSYPDVVWWGHREWEKVSPTRGSGFFFLSFGEKKASWIPEESRRSMSTAGRTRRETRAQECAASAQTLPDVGAAAYVSISNISPAVAGSVVSVFSRASPMCDFLQKVTEQIRSGGSEPEKYAELTALLGNALRFSVHVRKFVVKVCVIVPFRDLGYIETLLRRC
jgi:hypothetical protein